MGYICKVLRIVTGTQKVLNRCNEDDDNEDEDVDNDREDERSLLQHSRLVWTTPRCALGVRMSRRSGDNCELNREFKKKKN